MTFSHPLLNIYEPAYFGFRGISEKDLAFRDQYSKLGELRSFTKCPVVAMTATVQNATIGFIKFSLNMDKCSETTRDIEKDNIS